MQLYNPFKPHVVYFNNGTYGVRKYTLFLGWEYYSQTDAEIWWFDPKYIPKYCLAETLEELKRPLDKGERIV